MKRRTNRTDRPNSSHRYSPTERHTLAALGAVTGTALATLLAAGPLTVTVTVSLSPEPHTVVISQAGNSLTDLDPTDTRHPVCPVLPVLPVLPGQATLTR